MNRRRLTGAFSDKSPLVSIVLLTEDCEFAVKSSDGRMLIFSSDQLAVKSTRTTIGVTVMNLKGRHSVASAGKLENYKIKNLPRYKVHGLPGPGSLLRPEDDGIEQITFQERSSSDKTDE